MSTSTVKTTQVIDPRIEPQPDPVYKYVIGPTQNQYYSLTSSSCSDNFISFNNLTTLGVDRAYLDTFEIEVTAEITFHTNAAKITAATPQSAVNPTKFIDYVCPQPDEWTFDSFPFNKCVDNARVNINGGAFFSEPLSYLRAKERYMDQRALSRCYENVCPVHRAYSQTESGIPLYNDEGTVNQVVPANALTYNYHVNGSPAAPTRYGKGIFNSVLSEEGYAGGFNNAIVKISNRVAETRAGSDRVEVYTITWREPIMVSPFSSRYDGTYGRPLYNITSLDLAFNLQGLDKMIRLQNYRTIAHDTVGPLNNSDWAATEPKDTVHVLDYEVHIKTAKLVYQVATLPSNLVKPMTTLVPYRRFVPYTSAISTFDTTIPRGQMLYNVTSGVYTLNEIPTAIWMFVAPSKSVYLQKKNNPAVVNNDDATYVTQKQSWDENYLFGYIKKVDISMANTTQMLSTAKVEDLYRIAKTNGCEDSFLSWSGYDIIAPVSSDGAVKKQWLGAGSVLRLIPGVDLVVPDQALIPAANANNMVFQAKCDVYIPPGPRYLDAGYDLWLLFEYVGVGAISPGQCEITMNPLGSGEIMAASPVISATTQETEGTLQGSGMWDKFLSWLRSAHDFTKRNQLISKGAKLIADTGLMGPTATNVANAIADKAGKLGYGEPGAKRARGGAVMGLGDWT